MHVTFREVWTYRIRSAWPEQTKPRWSSPGFSPALSLFEPYFTSQCLACLNNSYCPKPPCFRGLAHSISSSVQLLSHVRLFATPWNAACQGSLSITNSRSSLKLMYIESVMLSSHLILSRPLLLLPPILPSIRVFSNESTLRKVARVSALASFLPKNTQDWSPSEWIGWISLQSKGPSRVFSNTTVQKHQFFGTQPSSQSNSHIHTWPQQRP